MAQNPDTWNRRLIPGNRPLVWLAIFAVSVQVARAHEDVEQLLFLGNTPRLLHVRVRVDGRPWGQHVQKELERQFTSLDDDSDGRLSFTEADAVRRLRGAQRLALTQPQLTAYDEDTDDHLGPSEFSKLFRQRIQVPISLVPETAGSTDALYFFGRLDRDANLRLTPEELSSPELLLHELDFDEDDAIGLIELKPFENPLLADDNSRVEDKLELPLRWAPHSWTTADWAALLHQRYGSEQGIPVAQLTSLCEDPSSCDDNSDGWLLAEELTNAADKLYACATIRLDIPLRTRGTRRTQLESQHSSLPRARRRLPTSVLSWSIDGIDFEFQALASTGQFANQRSFIMQQFIRGDENRDQRLNEQEFSGGDFQDINFAQVDRNRDSMVERSELRQYLEKTNVGLRTQLRIVVQPDGQSLFSLLDIDRDRRIGPRELIRLGDQVAQLDRNLDQVLDRTEFTTGYRVHFSLGTPPLFQPQSATRRNDSTAILRPDADGPEWFQNMDRNRDGDVSWSEFLGTRKQFLRADSNGDNLLSGEEAMSVGGSH